MQPTILVKIFTPAALILSCHAQLVTMPGAEGEFGVLPNHALMITSLQIGIMRVVTNQQAWQYFVYKGLAQVNHQVINVLSEFAIETTRLTKTEIIEKITALEADIAAGTSLNQLELAVINQNLSRYREMLACLYKI